MKWEIVEFKLLIPGEKYMIVHSENYKIIKGNANFKYVNYSIQDNFVRRNEMIVQLLIRTSPTTTREVDAYDIKIYKIDTSDKTITFDKNRNPTKSHRTGGEMT